MTVLLVSAGLFAFSFSLQAVLWRVWLPRRQTSALLVLYFVTPLLVIAIARAFGHSPELSAAEAVRVGLLYVSLTLAYIALYSAIEMQSPTLAIVAYVAKSGAGGCSEDELFARFGLGLELAQRLTLMEQGGWIQCEGDILRLTRTGRFYARLFERVAGVFGITRGVPAAG